MEAVYQYVFALVHGAGKDEKIYDKTVNSPFRDTGLLEYLTGKQIKQIIVAGLQTDYCIDATVKCGFEHGFRMVVPEETNSTFDNQSMSAKKRMNIIIILCGRADMPIAFP